MTTKAAMIIGLLHNNDLASSVYLAVVKNDQQIFLDAVSDANLTTDDLALSTDEFDSLVKGVKSSGELDLVTWEGYYESTSTQASNPLALLILSTTHKVYWGPRGQLLGNPNSHIVDYTLTTDGKLEFTTADDGKVSIALTRTYDDDAGTATVGFTGTRNGADISGSWATLPLYLPDDSNITAATTKGPATLNLSGNATEKEQGSDDLTLLKVWEEVWPWVSNIFTLIGGTAACYQIYLWIRDALRERRSTRTVQTLNDATVEYNALASGNCDPSAVSFRNVGTRATNDVLSRVNQDLNENPRDYDAETPDSVTQSLRDIAKAEFERSVRSYVRSRIAPVVDEALDKLSFLPYYDDLEKKIEDKKVSLQADPKIEEMGPSTSSYDPIVRSAVLVDRDAYYEANYAKKEEVSDGAEQEYEDAKEQRENIQSQIDEVDEQIAEDKRNDNDAAAQQDQARKGQLEKDLEQAESDESDKEGKKDEAESQKEDAKEKSDGAAEDVKDDTSRKGWDEKVADVFGE